MTKSRIPTNATQETRPSRMYPQLHHKVAAAVSDTVGQTYFKETFTDETSNNHYLTNIMGRFLCTNNDCKTHTWSSKIVAISIKGYPGNGYSAVVFHQRCRSCEMLGTLVIDEASYVERIAYRLKVWARVPVEQPPYKGKGEKPHESELCEGCKVGQCVKGRLLDECCYL